MAQGLARWSARTAGVIAAVAACAGLAGCGGGGAKNADAGSGASAGCPPAAVVGKASGPAAPGVVVRAAARYLAVRESWLAACRPSSTAWAAQARPLMTSRGWKTHPRDKVRVGPVRAAITRNRWNVRVTVACMANREAGRARADWRPLFCSLTDTTLDPAGAAVPTGKLPGGWPFAGEQNPVPLTMVNRGGTWLVDQDLTGLAQ